MKSRKQRLLTALALLLLLVEGPVYGQPDTAPTPATPAPTSCINETKAKNAGQPPPNVRLPTGVKPLRYAVTLAPYIYGSNASEFYFIGSMQVRLSIEDSTSNIKLHSAENIKLTAADIRVYDSCLDINYAIANCVYDSDSQWYSIDLCAPLPANSTNIVIEIPRFRSPLRSGLRGLYLSSYTEKRTTKYLATSQLQISNARMVFPCFDEPAFKARFDISIVREKGFTALSNMPSKRVTKARASNWFSEMSDSDQVEKEDFETTPIMSTYILAFVVSQFEYIEDTDSQMRTYRTYVRPELLNIMNFSQDALKNLTLFFESYFDVRFPLKKLDQIAVPDFPSRGMENWGLVVYRESYVAIDNRKDRAIDYQFSGLLVSHEVAHMWFGNLVTPQWWDDLWLNEGFASFALTIGVNNIRPDWDFDAQFVATYKLKTLETDSLANSHPIFFEVKQLINIYQNFDSITYFKSGMILRMLHGFVGDEVFRKGVGNYLRQNSYGNTFHTALYDSLTRQYSESTNKSLDVGSVMDRWIKQMGYPVLNCSVTAAGRLTLTQNHFLSDSSQVPSYPSDYNYTWIIPVTMGTKQNLTSGTPEDVSGFVNWMTEKEQAFELDSSADWYLLNLRSTGFYRVNYDLDNWKRLIDQLVADHTVFSPQDRARLLDDSFALASAGYLDYSIPLSMTKYLKKETHFAPWSAALSKIGYLRSMLQSRPSEYGPLNAYMRDLLEGAFNDVGLENKDTDTHLTKLKRELITSSACKYGLASCKTAAKAKFREYVNSGFRSLINPDFRPAVLCEGAEGSSQEEWDSLLMFSKTVSHLGTKIDIIRGLACSSKPSILERYLQHAANDSHFRMQEMAFALESMAKNPNGLQTFWNHLQNNWTNVNSKIPSPLVQSDVISYLGVFSDLEHYTEILNFKKQNKENLKKVGRALAQSLEKVLINAKWRRESLPRIKAWFAENGGSRK